MRGEDGLNGQLSSFIDMESRIHERHRLLLIREVLNGALYAHEANRRSHEKGQTPFLFFSFFVAIVDGCGQTVRDRKGSHHRHTKPDQGQGRVTGRLNIHSPGSGAIGAWGAGFEFASGT